MMSFYTYWKAVYKVWVRIWGFTSTWRWVGEVEGSSHSGINLAVLFQSMYTNACDL